MLVLWFIVSCNILYIVTWCTDVILLHNKSCQVEVGDSVPIHVQNVILPRNGRWSCCGIFSLKCSTLYIVTMVSIPDSVHLCIVHSLTLLYLIDVFFIECCQVD